MPSRFGQIVWSLAVTSVIFSFAGCRTTATKLASVPGLGWLDQEEERWAGYEPAPGLPRPSSTSEPTSSGSTSAGSIASKATTTPSARSPFGDSKEASLASNAPVGGKARFDTSRYLPGKSPSNSGTSNRASTYGDYASAYGKFGPPKSTSTKSSDPLIPQQGPYSTDTTPNYAKSGAGASTNGYDPLRSSRFGDGVSASNSVAPPTDDRASRFAASDSPRDSTRAGGTTTASSTSTYTPPGFIKKSVPSGLTASTTKASRFDRLSGQAQETTSTAMQPANDYVASAQNSLSTAAQRATSAANQAANQLPAAAAQPANSYLNTARSQLNSTTAAAATTRPGEIVNEFATSNTAGGYLAAAREHLGKAAPPANVPNSQGATPTGRFGNTVRDTVSGVSQGASRDLSRFAQQVEGASGQAYEQAKSTAGAFGKSLNQAVDGVANGIVAKSTSQALGAAKEGVSKTREAVTDYAGAGSEAARNFMRNVSAPLGDNKYPSTDTPRGYLDRPGSAPPATTTPPASTIRRSPTPYRPGSTSSFQSSLKRTSHSQLVSTSDSGRAGLDNHLVLAVGDKYQFPRALR